jgi:hypothetical protein
VLTSLLRKRKFRFLGTEDEQRYATVDLAERSMSEVETFAFFTAKMNITNSDKKGSIETSFRLLVVPCCILGV